jgi:squalene-associated FAD-dependent desaturase
VTGPERNPTVIVIGGGLAGLAAAAALGERGTSVMLLESRSRLGGRASSFHDKESGTRIDNCQHVSMGCCTNFRHFCDTVGVADLLRTERELYFVGPDATINRFAAGRLPAPLHLFSAFRKLSYLSKQEGQALSRGLRALARVQPAETNGQTFAEWLRAHEQTPEIMERFWHVVLVSALSESLDRIDVGHARKVFVDAFLANRGGWEVQIPTTSLDDLYGTKLTGWLAARHVKVRLRAGVQRMKMEGSRVAAVELRDGERIDAKHFIVAVPHYLSLPLLPCPLKQLQ